MELFCSVFLWSVMKRSANTTLPWSCWEKANVGNQQTKKEPYLKRQATVMILECYSIYIILITRTWETAGYISSGLALWTGVILKWPMWNKNGFWDKPVGQTVVQTKRFFQRRCHCEGQSNTDLIHKKSSDSEKIKVIFFFFKHSWWYFVVPQGQKKQKKLVHKNIHWFYVTSKFHDVANYLSLPF